MQIVNDIKSDIEALNKMRLPWWFLPCILIGGGLGYWFFDSIGRDSMELPAMNCIGVFGLLVALKWRLGRLCLAKMPSGRKADVFLLSQSS